MPALNVQRQFQPEQLCQALRLLIALSILLGSTPVYSQNTPKSSEQISTSAEAVDFNHLWVFVAGLHKFDNNYLHKGKTAVVVEDTDLIGTLSECGIPDDHLAILRDANATKSNCLAAFSNLLAKTRAGDFLLVIMHSHGNTNGIATYEADQGWKYKEIIDQIESGFAGNHACICLAACHSGAFIDTLKVAPRRVGYFTITSVSPEKSALTIATADYEACLADALSGSPCPDLNHDGVITFSELGKYIRRDQVTLFHTVPDVDYTDRFNPNMILTRAQPPGGPLQCCLVETESGIRGRVISQNGNRLLVRPRKFPERLDESTVSRVKVLGGEEEAN